MSWEAVAERAARARCAEILERMEAAIADHAPNAKVDRNDGTLRVRGRALKHRWLSEVGLRFAKWTRP